MSKYKLFSLSSVGISIKNGIKSPLQSRCNSFSLSTVSSSKYVPNFKNRSLPDYRNTPFASQFCPLSPIELATEKIKEYLSENSPETFEDWNEAKVFFFTEIPLISDVNYTSIIMNTLLNSNNMKLAQSFMNYSQESNLKPNILAYLQYFALCGKNAHVCGQEEIFRTFNKIQNFIDSTPVLDMKRGSYIIQGICGTDKWRSAFDYLKKIPFSPSSEIKNILASAAIRNGDEALAWEIITKWFRKGEICSNRVIEDFLKFGNDLLMKDKWKAETFLLKLFHHMECNSFQLSENAVKFVEKFFKNHSAEWIVNYSKVNRTGECEFCKRNLSPVELSDKEFSFLKSSFMEKSVKKGDIFINTDREEFEKYLSFVERQKPFHVVIDGLNVAFTTRKKKNAKNMAIHLLQVVERISSRSRRILVLGRQHMSQWPHNIMKKISNRSSVFLTNNISQEDPFMVYAALASGPNTYILTMDLMRDHMSRLDDPYLIALFKKWQQSHQILFTVDDDHNLKFIDPVRHSITIQGSMEGGWHIPYDDEIIREPYEELNNWLCIQRMT